MLQLLHLNPVLSRAVIRSLLRKTERKGEATTKNATVKLNKQNKWGGEGKPNKNLE